jgi:DNA-binding transcriptional ArsR family regulator
VAQIYNHMVVRKSIPEDEADRLFRALADATRRDILRRTMTGQISVSDLASHYAMSFAAVQKHVAVLEAAGLVNKTPSGRERLVRADPEQLARVGDLLAELAALWHHRLSRLDDLLNEPQE